MSKVYIGIDPGKGGGLACLDGNAITFKTMPKTDRGVYDWLMSNTLDIALTRVAIEWISPAMFGTGKASMSKLYGSYRALQMAVACCGFEATTVKAATWQRAVGLSPRSMGTGKAEWKQQLKRRAEELFPSLRITLATADALLIAHYCRLIHQEIPY